jgi:hypothetical protein
MRREHQRSVQCEATCHDLHAVCYGRYVEVELEKPPYPGGLGKKYWQHSFECLCPCHKKQAGIAADVS